MKRLSFYFLFLVLVLFSSCEIITNQTELSGTWKIKSLMANSEEYLYNDHVRDYAPDIAKSAIVFAENNTFELSFVYMDAVGADEPYAEIHRGTYTFDGDVVVFDATECIRAKETTCQFRGEVEGNMLYISKSFSAGDLWIIPIIDESAAVVVAFKLRE
jgi:hypothetical protein